MKTALWFVYFAIYQVASLFFLLKYKILKKLGKEEKAENYLHKVTSNWAKDMVKATGAEVKIEGIDNIPKDETVLFVSNHQGNFDIPLLLGYIPKKVGFVAKIELKKIPVVRTWMTLIKCVFMDRNDPRQSLKCILEAIGYLKEGHSMVVFPEGTRSKGKEMSNFKAGSMKLATKTNVKIVPITIDGSYKLLEESNKIKSDIVKLKFHEPIDVKNLSKDEKKDLHNIVRDIIAN